MPDGVTTKSHKMAMLPYSMYKSTERAEQPISHRGIYRWATGLSAWLSGPSTHGTYVEPSMNR